MTDFAEETLDRLVRYAAIDSQSDADSPTAPSTECQFDMLHLLRDELTGMVLELMPSLLVISISSASCLSIRRADKTLIEALSVTGDVMAMMRRAVSCGKSMSPVRTASQRPSSGPQSESCRSDASQISVCPRELSVM